MISDVSTTAAAPAQTAPATATPAGGKLGKNEFLTMLVAQLRHQDPLSPMNADDMAAQLAQFSSLEQLTNIGESLEAQAALQQSLIGSIHDTTALDVIGKTVLAAGDQIYLPGDGSGEVRFDVGGQGGLATVRVYDDTGKVVGIRELGFVNGGRHEFDLGPAAAGLPEGAYLYSVDVVDAAGKVVPTQTYTHAVIDGVEYGPNGPVLTSGPLALPFGTILQISSTLASEQNTKG